MYCDKCGSKLICPAGCETPGMSKEDRAELATLVEQIGDMNNMLERVMKLYDKEYGD